jgi:hypothetical protein
MHKYRISFVSGFAAGFVLGTRAGRERYEQMKKAARQVAENPTVQQAAGAVQAQASELASTASSKISDGVRDRGAQLARTARSKVEERVPGLRHNGHRESDGSGNGHVRSSGSRRRDSSED